MKPLDHKTIEQQELIERYVMKQLSEEEAEALEEHFFECDECFAKLKLTEKTILGIRQVVEQSTYHKERPSGPRSFLQKIESFFIQPAFGIAAVILILLLIYPAFKWIWFQQHLQEWNIPKPINFSFTLQETSLRSIENIFLDQYSKTIKIPTDTEFFTLSFSILETEASNPNYQAIILNEKQEIIWQTDHLKPENEYGVFHLLCPRAFFKNGSYLLKINELNSQDLQSGKVHLFPFKVIIENKD